MLKRGVKRTTRAMARLWRGSLQNTLVQALNTAQRNQLSTNSNVCAASWAWTPTIRTTMTSWQYAMGLKTPWYSNSTVYTAQMCIVSRPGKAYVECSVFHQYRQRWMSVKRSVYVFLHIPCAANAKFSPARHQYSCQHRRSRRRRRHTGGYSISLREGAQHIYP